MENLEIGIVGCGVISDIYLTNLTKRFSSVKVSAVADIMPEKSAEKADTYGLCAMTFEDMLDDDSIGIILNLTAPAQHYDVNTRALLGGKHVYSEKTLAPTCSEAADILRIAREKNLRVGCAPDTFLGGGLQTAVKAVRDGWIGHPLSAVMFMASPGMESWHANPGFYYTREVGPVFDMGPYYFTALAAILGPVRQVNAMSSRAYDTRVITSQPLAGTSIKVDTDTHITGIVQMESGVLVNMIFSFDMCSSSLPYMEIYGTDGTLTLGNPDYFKGPVWLRGRYEKEMRELPIIFPYTENSRGLGLAQMCRAIKAGTPHAASGELAYHVLDAICAVSKSMGTGETTVCDSSIEPVPMLSELLPKGAIDRALDFA